MPSKREKEQPKVNTQPSSGLLQRIFGSSEMSPERQAMDESIQRAYTKVAREMPDVKPVTVSASDSGGIFSPIKKFFAASGNASTNPFTGNIYYNPAMMTGLSDFEKEQLMAHELTHSRQVQQNPFSILKKAFLEPDEVVPQEFREKSTANTPYWWRTHELEAYQAQRDRAARMKKPYTDPIYANIDKQLFPPRKPANVETGPSSTMLNKQVKRK